MGIGILFGGVVVLWAAFLLPWALRRYDEATGDRPIETFSERLRVLTRRGGQPESGAEREPLVSARSLRARTSPAHTAAATPRPSRDAARQAARRRRRVLLTLVTATLVVVALAAFSLVPWLSVAVPAVLVVSWLVLCRVQVRHEDDASWQRRRMQEPAPQVAATAAPGPDQDDREQTWEEYGIGADPVGDQPDEDPTAVITTDAVRAVLGAGPHVRDPHAEPVSDADLAEATAVAVPVATGDGSSLWDPLPVTLPTYVSAPKAARSIRTIDLAAPGTWTSGRLEHEQTQMPAAKVAPEPSRAVGD